ISGALAFRETCRAAHEALPAIEEVPMKRGLILAALALASVVLYVGCSDPANKPTSQAPPKAPDTKSQASPGEHAHKPGGHGGIIAEIGRDKAHAEAVFAKEGTIKIFTLGSDETRVLEVERQTLEAYARIEGGDEDVEVNFHPIFQRGDTAGKASAFA